MKSRPMQRRSSLDSRVSHMSLGSHASFESAVSAAYTSASSDSDLSQQGTLYVPTCTSAMEKRLAARGMAVPVKEIRSRKPAPVFMSTRPLRNSERGLANFDEPAAPSPKSCRRLSIGICAENVIQPTRTVDSPEEPYRPRVTRRSSIGTSCAENVMPTHSARQRRSSIGVGGGRKTSRRASIGGASNNCRSSSHPPPSPIDSTFDETDFTSFDDDPTDYGYSDATPTSNEFVAFPASPDFSSGFDGTADFSSSGFGCEYSSGFADTTDYGYGDDSPGDYGYEEPSNHGSEWDHGRAPVVPNSQPSAPKTKGRRTTKVPRRSSCAGKC